MKHKPIPVSILVGFLGSGKTTLLNSILSQNHGRKIAVIVNEFGEVNVDARLVRHTTERIIEMSNGCICCTLRDDLLQELRELSQIDGLEYILIEATGIAEPMPIARTFYMEGMEELVRLDSIITMVDAANFWTDFEEEVDTLDIDGTPCREPLASLLIEQLEFTNIVLINKCDLVAQDELAHLETFLRHLNAGARIFRTVEAELDPAELIDTGLYDYESGAEAEDWAAESVEAANGKDEHGFSSFVFRSEKFLSWQRFEQFLGGESYETVTRSKGVAFFDDHAPVFISQAGSLCQVEELDPVTEEEMNAADEAYQTELVFIGMGMPQQKILDELGACCQQEERKYAA